ncbi:MAG TPA: hypothetical protein VFB28_02830 [Terriglobales bacterium]|nr:hypothetical protein [Terriglobales bacterium]
MGIAHRLLICALCTGLAVTPALAQTQTVAARTDVDALPDSPGFQGSAQDQSASPTSNIQQPPATSGTQPQSPSANQAPTQKPAGTAAAEAPKTTGIAASKPAGAAFAPAKQRRVRILLIEVGAIVAAGAAVGAVAALSHASPSKPPGAP